MLGICLRSKDQIKKLLLDIKRCGRLYAILKLIPPTCKETQTFGIIDRYLLK
jgi:hypothetical protein